MNSLVLALTPMSIGVLNANNFIRPSQISRRIVYIFQYFTSSNHTSKIQGSKYKIQLACNFQFHFELFSFLPELFSKRQVISKSAYLVDIQTGPENYGNLMEPFVGSDSEYVSSLSVIG
jgi:hypothetical protein